MLFLKNIRSAGEEGMKTRPCNLWEGDDQGKRRVSLGPNADEKHTFLYGAGWAFTPLTPQPGAGQELDSLEGSQGRFA